VGQVRRRTGDGISGLTGKRRLADKHGIGIQGIGRRRRDAGLSEEGPELCSLDDRVGRRGQVFNAAAWIESVIEASQTADGADSEEFSTHLVMCDIGDDDDRAGWQDRLQPRETSYDMRLAGKRGQSCRAARCPAGSTAP
jgi:hypothetical protein